MVTELKDWTATEIRELRQRRRLTQQMLAGELSVSRVTVANWEASVYRPRLSHMASLDKLDQNGSRA